MKKTSQKSIKSYADLLNMTRKIAIAEKPLRELTANEVELVSGAGLYRGCGNCK